MSGPRSTTNRPIAAGRGLVAPRSRPPFGWFTAVVFHIVPRPLPAVANAVGLGLVVLGMLPPRRGRAERLTQAVILGAAIFGLLL
jgi:hypothetical protein